MDDSFIRAGRLDDVQEVLIKTPQSRREILDIMTQRIPFNHDDPSNRNQILDKVSRVTHGFVPSDLQSLCTQVVLQLIHQKQDLACFSHFEDALKIVRPSNMSEYASKVYRYIYCSLFFSLLYI